MSNYSNGIEFLLSLETQGIKMGLRRTKQLLSACNNPENHLKSIQIIGTNGKGSTASCLSSILENKKLTVGLYTSPHLVRLNERIQINRIHISDSYIDKFINQYSQDIIDLSCTFFEVMTVMSLKYFTYNNVDIAILETGLGGQFDSVTACKPMLQLFTSISKDHMHILGNTLDDIATEKAKAIQPNVPCISVNQNPTVQKVLNHFAKENNTSILYNMQKFIKSFHIPLEGTHQEENIGLAITAAKHIIEINEKDIINGIKNIYWPGRNQIISQNPTIVFDVAHNESSIIEFLNTMASLNIRGNKILLISLQKTKIIDNALLGLVKYFNKIICTHLNNHMYSTDELSLLFNDAEHVIESSNPDDTIISIVNSLKKEDLFAIIGSHYWGPHIKKSFKNSFVS